ncbi:MAG: FAD:protein FMN transferase [Deltaproteobacteria bacterium]|nr:FAD:protein FMN transferase [Deltaproteobacteria bacterium]
MTKRIALICLLALCLAGLLFLTWQRRSGESLHEAQRGLMGTVVKIKASGKGLSRERFAQASANAFGEIERLEKEMSEWLPDSPISQAARQAGQKAVPVSEEILAVAELALSVSRKTEGAFDISFKPLGRLWDVGKRREPPEEALILKARRLVDYHNILLDKERRTLFLTRPGMAVGLGAVAKGYAAGRAAQKMREGGIGSFIIDAGGDLYFSGNRSGKAWTCGIKDPDGKSEPLIRLRVRKDCAIVTSGDYERYFEFQGRRYHHIIDARTGYPATGSRSVTVMSLDPAVADAYATAFFILGPQQAVEMTKGIPGLAFILIDAGGKIWRGGPLAEFVEEIGL